MNFLDNMGYRKESIKAYCEHCGADQNVAIIRFQGDNEAHIGYISGNVKNYAWLLKNGSRGNYYE